MLSVKRNKGETRVQQKTGRIIHTVNDYVGNRKLRESERDTEQNTRETLHDSLQTEVFNSGR